MIGAWDLFPSSLLIANAAGGPETIGWWIDLLFHLDDMLKDLITDYGGWTHLILFAVIFCETGLVVTPFLPGDSLLFLAGAFASAGALRMEWLLPLLIVAAVLGDTMNYWLGHLIGDRAMNGGIPFLKKEHFDKTHAYFEKYGGKTIIIARFVPIVRTFAPFVAGIGAMNYRRFFLFNVIGGVAWVLICLYAGYFFGNLPIVKKNFELVVVGIVGISVLPMLWEWFSHRAEQKKIDAQSKPAEA